jgi:hypothetical protein
MSNDFRERISKNGRTINIHSPLSTLTQFDREAQEPAKAGEDVRSLQPPLGSRKFETRHLVSYEERNFQRTGQTQEKNFLTAIDGDQAQLTSMAFVAATLFFVKIQK